MSSRIVLRSNEHKRLLTEPNVFAGSIVCRYPTPQQIASLHLYVRVHYMYMCTVHVHIHVVYST